MTKTTYKLDAALGQMVEKSPDPTEASLRQIRLTCLSIAAKEAGRRGAKGDVEKRAEEMVRYVLGKRDETKVQALKDAVYEQSTGVASHIGKAGPVQSTDIPAGETLPLQGGVEVPSQNTANPEEPSSVAQIELQKTVYICSPALSGRSVLYADRAYHAKTENGQHWWLYRSALSEGAEDETMPDFRSSSRLMSKGKMAVVAEDLP